MSIGKEKTWFLRWLAVLFWWYNAEEARREGEGNRVVQPVHKLVLKTRQGRLKLYSVHVELAHKNLNNFGQE